MADRNFGQYIEQGLIDLGDNIYRIYDENKKHDKESILLGLISDTDKVKMLKADLYRKARVDGDVTGLCQAIRTLESSIQQEFYRNNTFEAVVSRYITTAFLLGVTAVLASFAISWGCGSSKSQFCNSSKAISNAVTSQFQSPKTQERVLPANLN